MSNPLPLPVWGEVGQYFDRCISSSRVLEMEADEAVRKAGLALGYDSLKVEQIAALCAFVGA